ncbi:MAG TPA: hypothetical protein VL523_14395 [Terriglobia bacterium]|nr:hypothetical protein [Terriglobia bacterium]
MRNRWKIAAALGAFALATGALGTGAVQLNAKPAAQDDSGIMAMVLNNGKQRSFGLADVARIEFNTAASPTPVLGRARFLGEWTVGDGAGGKFMITLKSDGSAHKTMGDRRGGTWTVVNGEARITWDDGWHDAIRKAGSKYEKAAYSPGHSFSDEPDNVADAVKHPEPN